MRLTTFTFLTALALLYAGLTLAETAMYQTWDRALLEQKDLQNKVIYFQRLGGFAEQLLRRLAVDSQHDPALAQLLKEHRIKVVFTPVAEKDAPGGGPATPAAGIPSPSATPGGAPAVAPNNLPQPPQTPDAAHP
jgi:hypothetical protein